MEKGKWDRMIISKERFYEVENLRMYGMFGRINRAILQSNDDDMWLGFALSFGFYR